MDIGQLDVDDEVRELLLKAGKLARDVGHARVGIDHLLVVAAPIPAVAVALRERGLHPGAVKGVATADLALRPQESAERLELDEELLETLHAGPQLLAVVEAAVDARPHLNEHARLW